MSTHHTPLPWQISEAQTVDGTTMIVGGEGFEFGLIADVTSASDAALILKAVNGVGGATKANLAYLTNPSPGRFLLNIQVHGQDDITRIEVTANQVRGFIADGAAMAFRAREKAE